MHGDDDYDLLYICSNVTLSLNIMVFPCRNFKHNSYVNVVRSQGYSMCGNVSGVQ